MDFSQFTDLTLEDLKKTFQDSHLANIEKHLFENNQYEFEIPQAELPSINKNPYDGHSLIVTKNLPKDEKERKLRDGVCFKGRCVIF